MICVSTDENEEKRKRRLTEEWVFYIKQQIMKWIKAGIKKNFSGVNKKSYKVKQNQNMDIELRILIF